MPQRHSSTLWILLIAVGRGLPSPRLTYSTPTHSPLPAHPPPTALPMTTVYLGQIPILACTYVHTHIHEKQLEYRRHQDNLGAASVREERGGGGFPAASPGFGPRGGPPGAWSRNRAGGARGGDDHHHKVRSGLMGVRTWYSVLLGEDLLPPLRELSGFQSCEKIPFGAHDDESWMRFQ